MIKPACLALVLLASPLQAQPERFWEPPPDPALEAAPSEVLLDEWRELPADERDQHQLFSLRLSEKRQVSEWLLAVGPTRPVEESTESNRTRLYASTGAEFEFNSEVATLESLILGPLIQRRNKDTHSTRSMAVVEFESRVNADFLRLGLHQASEFSLAARELEALRRFRIDFSYQPIPEDELLPLPQSVLDLGIGDDHIQSLATMAPALGAFLGVAMQAEPLADVLKKTLRKPSLFSVLSRGVNFGFSSYGQGATRLESQDWGLPVDQPAYLSPVALEINERLSLEILLVVTEPLEPLKRSAGIIGLYAEPPDDEHKRVVMRWWPKARLKQLQ